MDEPIRPPVILIVDEEPAQVYKLRGILRRGGYPRIEATIDGSEALELFREHRPDLLLLGLEMTHVDGLEVFRALQAEIPSTDLVPIVLLSSGRDPDRDARALAHGAYDLIRAPFLAEAVLARVRNLLRMRALHRTGSPGGREPVGLATRAFETERLAILRRMAILCEYREDPSGRHAHRVGRVAAAIARQLGLDGVEAARLRLAAPLHDIGKIGIPDSVLLKPGPLSEAEWSLMRRHPAIGAEIVGRDQPGLLLPLVAEICRTHHERWDGRGYPDHLAGEAIPLAGRIVAVADAFDTMTHSRPYRPARPVRDAIEELRACAGSLYDPAVVDALLAVLKAEASRRVELPSGAATGPRVRAVGGVAPSAGGM